MVVNRYRPLSILLVLLFSSAITCSVPLIPFSWEKKPLTELLDILAEKKRVNIILPQAAVDLEALKNQTITYRPEKRTSLPVVEAWELIKTFLELSGFSIIEKKDALYEIIRHGTIEEGSVQRNVLPWYAETEPAKLPSDTTRIRYLIFLRNLKVPPLIEKETHALTKMLKQLLSKNGSIVYDTRSNGILLTDMANHIASVVRILKEFDGRGLVEEVAYVPLRFIPVRGVVALFDALKKASGDSGQGPAFIRSDPGADALTFFTRDTTIIADERRNGIIIMGRQANVERITDFIHDSVDTEPDKGGSILHHYDLQYLDAKTFAPLLQQIVSSFIMNGTQATQKPVRRGEEHTFKGVQIVAEPLIETEPTFTTEAVTFPQTKGSLEKIGIEGISTRGGNRLIIAARQDDWQLVKAFIKKLDKPQYSVVLEILIVDFSYATTTKVAGDIRSKTQSVLPNGVEFLSSNITPVSNVLGNTPTQLANDLLQVIGPQSVTSQLEPGSLLLSINDPQTPGIFGLLQVLQRVLKGKIRSYPYLMMTNHKKGSVEAVELRRDQGDLVTTTDGSFTIPIEDVEASLRVSATPHVLSQDRLRLDIGFTSEEFQGSSFTRFTRGLKTTATLSSGQILVMGGLMRTEKNDFVTQTPVFGYIPLLGFLFKNRNRMAARTNIALLVSPTIIGPYSRKPLTEKTHNRICLSSEEDDYCDERDPIHHIFLKSPPNRLINNFYAASENLSDFTQEACKPEPVKLITPTRMKRYTRPYNSDVLKELLAHSQTPFSGIKNTHSKSIFNN